MKKLLSLALALVMMLSCMTLFVSAAPAANLVEGDLINEDFASFVTDGFNYYNGGIIDATDANVAVEDGYLVLTGDADGSFLKLRPQTELLSYYIGATNNIYTPLFAVEFKVKVGTGEKTIITEKDPGEGTVVTTATDLFHLGSLRVGDDTDRQFFVIRPQGRIATAGNNNQEKNAGVRFSLVPYFASDSDWKTVKMVYNTRGANTHGYCDLYIYGEQVLGAASAMGGVSNVNNWISAPSAASNYFTLGLSGNAEGKQVYLDDIKIYNIYGDQNGKINELPRAIGYQKTETYKDAEEKDVYDVRFAASVGSFVTGYDNVGFEITATYEGGSKTWDLNTSSDIYRALNGTTPEGKTVEAIAAADVNASAVFAATITGVPAEETIDFTITPYVMKGETKFYGAAEEATFKPASALTHGIVKVVGATCCNQNNGAHRQITNLYNGRYDGASYNESTDPTGDRYGTTTSHKISNTSECWFTYDFGEAHNIETFIMYERGTKVDLINKAGSTTKWGIFVSNDNANWTPVTNLVDADMTDGVISSPKDVGNYTKHTFTFDEVKTRYVKVVYGSQSATEAQVDLREAEFLGTN